MLTLYLTAGLLALVALGLLVAWWTGLYTRRRAQRYVPIGLMGRRYVVWFPIPRKQPHPVPVVLAFHGEGSTAEHLERDASIHTARQAAGFAIVYPEGYHMSWNAGRCCGDAMQSGIDDVKFVRALLDDLETVVKIDRRRIYATGFCNGAMFCYYLACTMSEEIAAIAPVGGNMFVAECAPLRPVPIFHLHGLADQRAPYHADRTAVPDRPPAAEQGLAFWRRINRSRGETRERLFGDAADCTIYAGEPDGVEIRVCVFPQLGHHWPGGAQQAAASDAAALAERADVNDAILRFLARYSLPEPRLRRISLAAPAGAR